MRTYAAVWIDVEPIETKIRRKHRCFKGQRVRPLLILLSVPCNASDQTWSEVEEPMWICMWNHHGLNSFWFPSLGMFFRCLSFAIKIYCWFVRNRKHIQNKTSVMSFDLLYRIYFFFLLTHTYSSITVLATFHTSTSVKGDDH